MAECPKCHRFIPATAQSHSCGWSALGSSGNTNHIQCGFEGCPKPATIRLRTKGWTNVCFDHYMHIHQEQALTYCREKGLYTVEAMTKHCSPILHKIFRHRSNNGTVEF